MSSPHRHSSYHYWIVWTQTRCLISSKFGKKDLIENDKAQRGASTDLAAKCASTFCEIDYPGGSNRAFTPFDKEAKKAVKSDFIDASYADIIVLAGQVSFEDTSIPAMAFCAGRATMPLIRQAATMPSPSCTILI